MSERLRQLRHQHTLLREHLAWLETEIARESDDRPVSPLPAPVPSVVQAINSSPTTPPFPTSHTVAPIQPAPAKASLLPDSPAAAAPRTPSPILPEADAAAIMERYGDDEKLKQPDIKRGCLVAFAVVMAALIGTVGAIWLAFYR